ncbi:hypothetical protein BGLT_02003 [Caballeronia glathei]|jgi:hypothetical protein|uniref:Uncharacterized protein n=1 Tax=Caballeronia glathei TaxID=60547 RepID=A0A069PRL4_9BURK|nr:MULTISPECIES: hypothetical protein [Burkholderiaceae]KDR43215.1 hypothetical protein BG61_40270 [Caballeronia glathei]TCK39575.1 hypothetical protein B0G84_4915 [Paraburkholderia sp. BL8N3]CDY79307.1 hypothetical protein BGLT_02003 [Caballeronia glathei]
MPEQISKYPDVTLQVLKGAGAKCGEGAEQKILKQCPAERFCSLPTGEICVYGIDGIANMTQISPREIATAIAPLVPPEPADPPAAVWVEAIILGIVFFAGIVLGRFLRKRRSVSP